MKGHSLFFEKHKAIIETIKSSYKLIITYLILVVFLGITEGFGLALLFPIAELIQDNEIASQYINIFYEFTGYQISTQNLIYLIFIATFSLFLLSGILQLVSYRVIAMLLDGLYANWQRKIYGYYLNAKYSFFIDNMSGDLVQKLMLHSERGVQIVQHACVVIKELFILIFITIILFSISIKLTLLLGIVGIFFTLISIFFGRLNIFSASEKIALHQKNAVSLASESFSAIKLIKAYSLEKYFNIQFSNEIQKRTKYIISNNSLTNAPATILRTATLLIMLTALFIISNSSNINVSQSISFLILFAGAGYKLNTSVGTMNNSFLSMANVIPSLKIISEELSNYYNSPDVNKKTHTFKELEKAISFNEVSFKYIDTSKPVLNKINIQINKGSLVGIIGESGSGKSTIVDLILKLYDVCSGEIKIDNINIKQLNKSSWRNSISYVGQNTQILSGDIKSNITLNFDKKENINDKILEATNIADIDNFILGLEEKFLTKVNESGDNLSAGQKQRIAISRAIYRNPKIFLFDEATNNLNPTSEEKILNKFFDYLRKNNKTLIYVTHRIDILDKLDEIIFLNNGEISAKGKHHELISNNSDYKKFINKSSDQ